MARICLSCGKGVLSGHNVSHSKRRTVRKFKPNLHVARVEVNGMTKKMKLCTKCLRMYKRVAAAGALQKTLTPETVAPVSA